MTNERKNYHFFAYLNDAYTFNDSVIYILKIVASFLRN